MADAWRDNLKAAVRGQSQPAPEEQPQVTEESQDNGAEPTTDGNTQKVEQSAAPAFEFEIGKGKFKTWEEAKNSEEYKRLHNLDKLWGRQAKEVEMTRAEIKSLKEHEAYKLIEQWKKYPEFAKRQQALYAEFNAELAGGATRKEASQATGLPLEVAKRLEKLEQLEKETAENSKFREFIVTNLQQQQIAANLDAQEKELRAAAPDLDDRTYNAVIQICQEYGPKMTMIRALNMLKAELAAQKAPAKAGIPGKMATVKETPKPLKDLSDADTAKANIRRLMKEKKA